MKVIDKALSQLDYFPQKGWWGYFDGEKHYLMRYSHVMLQWNPGKIISSFYETITDKNGVIDAAHKVIDFKIDDFIPLYKTEHLSKMLDKSLKDEEYELSAKIRNELLKRS